MMENEKHIILASGSPRRIQMFKDHGFHIEVRPADVDENLPEGIEPRDAVMYLALKKGLWVEEQLKRQQEEDNAVSEPSAKSSLIVAADTVVYVDGQILGKPRDREDAYRMISQIAGGSHYVATGVCLLRPQNPLRACFYDATRVYVKPMTKEDINGYLDTDEPYDKAGAYAIQGIFGKFIDRIEGDMNNVIGFPWNRFEEVYNRIK